MKRKRNNNSPRRKRMNRKARLVSAQQWVKTYSGKSIVRGYAKWYAVDLLCAIKELRMINVAVDAAYEEQVKQSLEAQRKCKQQRRTEREEDAVNLYTMMNSFLLPDILQMVCLKA